MKFEDYKEVITDKYGFQFVKNDVMIGTEEQGCLICGTPTKYIEVCSEAHFCSDECVDKFYNQLSEYDELRAEFEEEANRISDTYQINGDHTRCYLSNFEDSYICHRQNGSCKNIGKCREIFGREKGENNAR